MAARKFRETPHGLLGVDAAGRVQSYLGTHQMQHTSGSFSTRSSTTSMSGPVSAMGTVTSSIPKARRRAQSGGRTRARDTGTSPDPRPSKASPVRPHVHRGIEHEEHQRETGIPAGDHLSRRDVEQAGAQGGGLPADLAASRSCARPCRPRRHSCHQGSRRVHRRDRVAPPPACRRVRSRFRFAPFKESKRPSKSSRSVTRLPRRDEVRPSREGRA